MIYTHALRRFSARGREYKYYILQHGELDIGAMQEAAAHFVGDHDFRQGSIPCHPHKNLS